MRSSSVFGIQYRTYHRLLKVLEHDSTVQRDKTNTEPIFCALCRVVLVAHIFHGTKRGTAHISNYRRSAPRKPCIGDKSTNHFYVCWKSLGIDSMRSLTYTFGLYLFLC